jgi:hypothetical protein
MATIDGIGEGNGSGQWASTGPLIRRVLRFLAAVARAVADEIAFMAREDGYHGTISREDDDWGTGR